MKSIHIDNVNEYAIVYLNRPEKKNVFDYHMFNELATFFRNDAEKYKCIIVTGKGAFFSAGIDVDFVNNLKHKLVSEQNNIVVQFMSAFTTCPVPICAVLNGPAIGIGFTLLMWCDFVFHNKNATYLKMPFIQLGLTPDFGASTLLAKMVGKSVASEILYCASSVTPDVLSSGCVESIDQVVQEKLNVLLGSDIALIKKYKMLSSHGTIYIENESLREIMRSML